MRNSLKTQVRAVAPNPSVAALCNTNAFHLTTILIRVTLLLHVRMHLQWAPRTGHSCCRQNGLELRGRDLSEVGKAAALRPLLAHGRPSHRRRARLRRRSTRGATSAAHEHRLLAGAPAGSPRSRAELATGRLALKQHVVLHTHSADQLELRLEKIDVLFLAVQNLLEQQPRIEVLMLLAQRNAFSQRR